MRKPPSPKTVARVLSAAEACNVRTLRESAAVGAIVRTFLDLGQFDHVYARTVANELIGGCANVTPKTMRKEMPTRCYDGTVLAEPRDLMGDFSPITGPELAAAVNEFKRQYDPPTGVAA